MSYDFEFTPKIVQHLQSIERSREAVRLSILPPLVAEGLRFAAYVRSTHFSTQIEGNRLTLKETEAVIEKGQQIPGRERDVKEVERYYLALQQVEKWVAGGQEITKERICKIHALLYRGRRAKSTPYRDGQNVIRDRSGGIVYLPPEVKDVPKLMEEMVEWLHQRWDDLPIPLIAGMAHYQFVTIHPFDDGNGRTARTLTTWILFNGGYDLGRFFSLEEFYVEDIQGYYNAIVTHPHHNYYEGRAEAEVTSWLEYFLNGMEVVFARAAQVVEAKREEGEIAEDPLLKKLDFRARRVLSLFSDRDFIKSTEVGSLLSISVRQARTLLTQWVEQGWLEVSDPSRRGRKYRLAREFRKSVIR